MAKDFDYNTLIKAALGYEQSRKASGTIRATAIDDVRQLTHTQEEVDNIVARVMAGKTKLDLIKTQLDLNTQTAHHTTGHTILADAQHKAKPVLHVKKRTTLQAHPLAKGGIP